MILREWKKLRAHLDKYNRFLLIPGDGIVEKLGDIVEDEEVGSSTVEAVGA